MEVEVRFYFPKSQLSSIMAQLEQHADLLNDGCYYEKTMLYDNPNPDFSFYSKEIDGRFRIRVSKHTTIDRQNCIVSWKRRISKPVGGIHKEEEVELKINFEEYENLVFLVSNVIKMERIESYERYRHVFSNSEIEVCVDEFPFGIALELELKGTQLSDTVLHHWLKKLSLNIDDSYNLSCDDKYKELCAVQGIAAKRDILFDDEEMPEIGNTKAYII